MGTACATGGAAEGASGTSVVPGPGGPGDNGMGEVASGAVRSRFCVKPWLGAMAENSNAAAHAAARPTPLKPRIGIAFFQSQSRQFHVPSEVKFGGDALRRGHLHHNGSDALFALAPWPIIA